MTYDPLGRDDGKESHGDGQCPHCGAVRLVGVRHVCLPLERTAYGIRRLPPLNLQPGKRWAGLHLVVNGWITVRDSWFGR